MLARRRSRRMPRVRWTGVPARLLVPLALMALIFALSAQSDPGPDLGGLQTAASYVAHLILYAALWTAFAWALRWQRPALAFALAVLYGVTDELHQSAVAGRDASSADVLADALGAAAAWAATSRLRRRRDPRAAAPGPRPAAPTSPHSR